jgi:hypothetical protein
MNEKASQLINQAEAAARVCLEGQPATRKNLDALAAEIKKRILLQAEAGMWADLGIREAHQLQELEVWISVAPFLKPPIRIHYEFAQTDLHTLVVERRRRGVQ